jgi:hypothetical protein
VSEDQPDFWKEGGDDDPKYVDKFRNCGRCGNEFWSNAAELANRRFFFIPLFCEVCSWLNGVELRRRTLIWREKMRSGELRWKAKPLTGTKPWEKAPPPEPAGSESAADLLAGVADALLKPPKKRGKKIAKNP